MTKLVERITIDIEMDVEGYGVHRGPRDQLATLWSSIGHMLDAKGKWTVKGPGLVCYLTSLGLEEVPEESGADN